MLGRVVKHQPGVCTAGGLLISSAFTRQADETRAQLERTADGQELLRQIDAQSTRPSRPGVESGPGFMSKFRQATAERNAQKVGPGSSCTSRRTPLPPLLFRLVTPPFPLRVQVRADCGSHRAAHSQPDAPRGRYGHTASTASSWCSWYLRPAHQCNVSCSHRIEMGTFRSLARRKDVRFTRGSLRFSVT